MKRDLGIVILLMAAATAVQWLQISRAVTPAQDAVRFVAIAQRMEQSGLRATMRDETEHPLYPAAIRATFPVVEMVRGVRPDNWMAAAQIAAAIPLVVCVLPIFMLLSTVVPRAIAFTGTLLLVLTREISALGASALADGWTVLFTAVFLWAVVKVVASEAASAGERESRRRWAQNAVIVLIAGTSVGLAASSHQLALASAVAALPFACWQVIRNSGSRAAAAMRLSTLGAAFAAGLAVVLIPWLGFVGVKNSGDAVARLLGRETTEVDQVTALWNFDGVDPALAELNQNTNSAWMLAEGQAMSFAKKDPNASIKRPGLSAAFQSMWRELPLAFGYVVGCLALLGAVMLLRRVDILPRECQASETRRPAALVLTGFFFAYLAMLTLAAAWLGYLARRHLAPAVIVALPCSATAAWTICQHGSRRFTAFLRNNNLAKAGMARRFMFAALLCGILLLIAIPLASPLHPSRAGHRMAAEWLAAADRPTGAVLDTRGWTQLYTGRRTHLLTAGKTAIRDVELRYIVLEQKELDFESDRAATLREIVNSSNGPVARFDVPGQKPGVAVVIYEWNAARFASRKKTRLAQRSD